MQDRINISTHSLTRRLTDIGWHGHKSDDISTHSLTRRLTKILCTMQRKYGISTHSLTRRLTPHPLLLSKFVANFNSQPHKEADHLLLYFCVSFQHFNSQPHKEADSNFRQKHIYPKLIFLLIIHISLIFYSNHHILNYFSCKLYVFPGANVLEYFCELTFRTIILRYL